MRKITYLVYDLKFHEQCVLATEDIGEVAKFLQRTRKTISSAISRKTKIGCRYLVEVLNTKELEEKR